CKMADKITLGFQGYFFLRCEDGASLFDFHGNVRYTFNEYKVGKFASLSKAEPLYLIFGSHQI
ncbi:MAG: hypothetical protein IKD62_00695, partial [Oscillospiraceae bacterium]|nr:hypothetical protein [Oscillospiraceae bacterium]